MELWNSFHERRSNKSFIELIRKAGLPNPPDPLYKGGGLPDAGLPDMAQSGNRISNLTQLYSNLKEKSINPNVSETTSSPFAKGARGIPRTPIGKTQKKPPRKERFFSFNRRIDYLVMTTRWTLLRPLLSYTLKKYTPASTFMSMVFTMLSSFTTRRS